MGRLAGAVLAIITWLLVAASVVIIAGALLGRPVLLAAVPSGSMTPTLQPGDLILVLPTWGRTPQVGDIVVFRAPREERWIVHRIVGGSPEDGFITRGDRNPAPDPGRVLPRDIVGRVPLLGKGAVRIPHLGLLSPGDSPLANPLVAGVALVVGVYLLLADVGAGLGRLRRAGRRWHRRLLAPRRVLPTYLALAAGALAITLVSVWSLSSRQPVRYRVVAQAPAGVQEAGRVLAGTPRVEVMALRNPSLLPLIFAFRADDPHILFDPAWAVVPPGGTAQVQVTVSSPVLGEHRATLYQAVYLPLLPVAVLRALAAVHWHLPAVAVALVPALAVLALGAADPRVPAEVRRLVLAWRLRAGF